MIELIVLVFFIILIVCFSNVQHYRSSNTHESKIPKLIHHTYISKQHVPPYVFEQYKLQLRCDL